ncbi:MAG: hypothetical protein R3237_05505 [Nitrosopumilaceae archaeon]|nr:hypothetical protein [Nitrosopumilaceae archaeon]
MTPKLELDEAAPDYLEWLLKTKGIEIEKLKKSVDRIESYNESMDLVKIQELEQTKELLVHLTNKLFKKIESLEKKEQVENPKIETEEKTFDDNPKERETCKIEFTDLTWYRERLNGKK